MIKYCECCGIEIADTEVDTMQRYNAVRFCYDCATERKKKQTKECKKRASARARAEKNLRKEKNYLASAEEVLSLRERARSVREQRVNMMSGMTEEQRLRADLKNAKRRIADLQGQVYQGGADYMKLYRKKSP